MVSGNWYIDCGDNCNFTSDTDIGGNNVYMSGSGLITGKRFITNYTRRSQYGGCISLDKS